MGDLLLRDANGNIVYDEEWGEAFLDISTDNSGARAKVNGWTDECAERVSRPSNRTTTTPTAALRRAC